jgi:cytochrome d ubiquinol oxidase subunit II
MELNLIWFILIIVLLTGYAVLDGMNLGIGVSYLSYKKDEYKQTLLSAIGPFWNGNEVWLMTGGGALFAAFPSAYASIFSGLYLAFILLLVGIIFRGIAVEFRNKEENFKWRQRWDIALSVSSIIVLLVLGVAVGNFCQGLPINENGDIFINLLCLFTPFTLIVGLQSVFFFAMHGAIYIGMKSESNLQNILTDRTKLFLYISFVLFCISFALNPVVLFINPFNVAMILLFAVLFLLVHNKKFGLGIITSSLIAALYIVSIAVNVFPNFVISTIDQAYSLTIYNASSSDKTLEIMLIIAGIGVPIMLCYTIFVYRVFKGKIKVDTLYD